MFTTGSATVTVAAHIPVHLWQIDTSPTYRIACPRSYGVSLWNTLSAAFAEYGFEMETGHKSTGSPLRRW
jgi:sarcosine oxidase gamma subunit